jgi:hypothetical protein
VLQANRGDISIEIDGYNYYLITKYHFSEDIISSIDMRIGPLEIDITLLYSF